MVREESLSCLFQTSKIFPEYDTLIPDVDLTLGEETKRWEEAKRMEQGLFLWEHGRSRLYCHAARQNLQQNCILKLIYVYLEEKLSKATQLSIHMLCSFNP